MSNFTASADALVLLFNVFVGLVVLVSSSILFRQMEGGRSTEKRLKEIE